MKLLSVRRDLRCFFFIREDCLEKSKRLQIPLQRQHFLLSYFKTLKVCPAGVSWTRDQPLNRSRVLPTELTMRQCCVELHCDTILNLLGRELIWPSHFGATTFGLFGLCPSSCWIRFFSWESFIGFYIWCYPISTILACLFICEVAKFVEKVVLEREHGGRNAISCLLPCDSYIVWRVNLSKLSWVLVWALRKTTNCILTFIQYFLQVLRSYIYSIHWNTVI